MSNLRNKCVPVTLRPISNGCKAWWVERSQPIRSLLSTRCYGADGVRFKITKEHETSAFCFPYSLINLFYWRYIHKMLSTDRLDALRERNKDFMNQLWQQREKLESLSGFSQRRKREREDEAEERRRPAEVLTPTLTDGARGPARAAPEKLTVRFAGNDTVTGYRYKRNLQIWAELVMPSLRSTPHQTEHRICPITSAKYIY